MIYFLIDILILYWYAKSSQKTKSNSWFYKPGKMLYSPEIFDKIIGFILTCLLLNFVAYVIGTIIAILFFALIQF